MVYADRLRTSNPHYLAQTNPCDLFLVSMMVASKFLYDDGVEDEVYNDLWAKAADLEVAALNREERRFLGAINWNLYVSRIASTALPVCKRHTAIHLLCKTSVLHRSVKVERDTSEQTDPDTGVVETSLNCLFDNPVC